MKYDVSKEGTGLLKWDEMRFCPGLTISHIQSVDGSYQE